VRIRGFGGVGEVGGNKFHLEAGGEGVLVDFGISYAARIRYFGWLLRPRKFNLLPALISTGAAPAVRGLYDAGLMDPMGLTKDLLEDAPELDVQGVVVSHPHSDHIGHVSLLRRDLPVYLGLGTYEVAKTRELTRHAMTAEDRIFIDSGRSASIFRTGDVVRIGSFEVKPVHVDHSVPGSYGLIIHSPEGSVAYSGDLRLHGPKRDFTEEFLEAVVSEGVEVFMIEGTRISEAEHITELDVERRLRQSIADRRGLVAVLMGLLDYDRFNSVSSASKPVDRTILVTPRMAMVLEAFNRLGVMPDELLPGRGRVEVYLERRGTGKYERQDYRGWERNYIESLLDRGIQPLTDLDVSHNQGRYIMVLNTPDDVLGLLPIKPAQDSLFIYSTSEPHNEEHELDRERVDNWLEILGMSSVTAHASGHADRLELEQIIGATRPRRVIPIHTESPHLFQGLVESASPGSVVTILTPRAAVDI